MKKVKCTDCGWKGLDTDLKTNEKSFYGNNLCPRCKSAKIVPDEE